VQLAFERGTNVGAQVFVLENDETYKMFHLKNREISFDVNLASLPCGTNAAFYLVAMNPSGQRGVAGNDAGAKFGTGYCDAQCPHALKFVQGEANMMDWVGASESGHFGSCCAEIDLWEGNSRASAFTAHPCNGEQTRCEGTQCGDTDKGEHYMGLCDKDGCGFNSYQLGAREFYGPGKQVDTMQPFTVVTQFLTADGTDGGPLTEIKQFYVQNGQVIHPPEAAQEGIAGDSISDGFCSNTKQAFINTRARHNPSGEFDQFSATGGLGAIGGALDAGMVLVMSLWDDPASGMRWLDSESRRMPESTPGVVRGPCSTTEGDAATVEATAASASVTYSNIKWGEIGSTASGVPGARAASPKEQPAPFNPPIVSVGAAAPAAGAYGAGDGAGAYDASAYGAGANGAGAYGAGAGAYGAGAYGADAYGQQAAQGQQQQQQGYYGYGQKSELSQSVLSQAASGGVFKMCLVIASCVAIAATALVVSSRRAARLSGSLEAELNPSTALE